METKKITEYLTEYVEEKEGYIAIVLGTYKIKSVRMENIKIFLCKKSG